MSFFSLKELPQALLTSGLGLLQNNKNLMFEALRPYYLFFAPPKHSVLFVSLLTNFGNCKTTVNYIKQPLIWG